MEEGDAPNMDELQSSEASAFVVEGEVEPLVSKVRVRGGAAAPALTAASGQHAPSVRAERPT